MSNSRIDHIVRKISCFMKIVGLWPRYELDWCTRLHFFSLIFIMFFFNIIPQTCKLLESKSFNDTLRILISAELTMGLAIVKMFGAWHHRTGRYSPSDPKNNFYLFN